MTKVVLVNATIGFASESRKVERFNFSDSPFGLSVGPRMERLAFDMLAFCHAGPRVLSSRLTGLPSRIVGWRVLLASR